MEQQPPLPAVEAGISQPRQRRSPTRHPRLRRHLLLRLVPAVPLGGSLGWTRQIVYARDVRTGYVRRVAVLRPTDADDPHESPDDHEPSPGAAARQQAGPSASVNWPLRKTA
jgi:hypothetical protein